MATLNKISTVKYANDNVGYSLSGTPNKCVKESDLPEMWACTIKESSKYNSFLKRNPADCTECPVFVDFPDATNKSYNMEVGCTEVGSLQLYKKGKFATFSIPTTNTGVWITNNNNFAIPVDVMFMEKLPGLWNYKLVSETKVSLPANGGKQTFKHPKTGGGHIIWIRINGYSDAQPEKTITATMNGTPLPVGVAANPGDRAKLNIFIEGETDTGTQTISFGFDLVFSSTTATSKFTYNVDSKFRAKSVRFSVLMPIMNAGVSLKSMTLTSPGLLSYGGSQTNATVDIADKDITGDTLTFNHNWTWNIPMG